MFRPHTAILSCYRILSSRSCCSVMPIFAYVMLHVTMCYIDGQKNKYSVLNECNRMLKYNLYNILAISSPTSGFPGFSIVRNSKNYQTQCFRNWIAFRMTHLLSLSVGVFLPHLQTKIDPVSESLHFQYLEFRTMDNPVILSVIHHRQNPFKSSCIRSVSM
jgi:hypothetical protein